MMGPLRRTAGSLTLGALLCLGFAHHAAAAAPLRVGIQLLPPALGNPFRTTGMPGIFALSATYDGLTRIDQQGEIHPWLALTWTMVDPTTWRITLRPNVTFSNGAPFTAEAVVATVAFLTSPAAAREIVARELRFLKSARVIDPLTVELITHEPTPLLPRALPLLYPVEPESWRRLGPEGYAKAPIGTGPFVIKDMQTNRWQLTPFAESWRKPKVDSLTFIAAPDATTRVQGVLADQLDIALGLGPEDVAAIEAGGGKGIAWRNAAVWAINLHQADGKNPALKDRRVREALNLAVDREALVKNLQQGKTVPATQPAPSMAYGYDPSIPPIPFDPARARTLLAEAGYPKGFRFVVQAVVGSGPADGIVYQQVAQDLARIGVTMEIRIFPVAQMIRSVTEGNWDGDAFGMTYATEPTIDVLRPLQQHSCLWSHPWYCDQSIMPKIHAAQIETDPAKALELRHEIMRFYRNEYASLYLYELPRFAGTRAGVSNFAEVHGFINFDQIEVKR